MIGFRTCKYRATSCNITFRHVCKFIRGAYSCSLMLYWQVKIDRLFKKNELFASGERTGKNAVTTGVGLTDVKLERMELNILNVYLFYDVFFTKNG